MSADHIFVYGSLRREFSSPARAVLKNHAEFIAKAIFQGKLYKIDWYPGAIESDDPEDAVVGEVYKMNDGETVLKELDRYEGCSPSNAKPHEFLRTETIVQCKNGNTLNVWIYLFNKSIEEKNRILSGDYSIT